MTRSIWSWGFLALFVVVATWTVGQSPFFATAGDTPARRTQQGERVPTPPEGAESGGVAEHEQLFRNWPKPKVALVFTGRQDGFLEPCGCSGLENQKGGMARRASMLSDLVKNKKWSVIPIDAGNQVRRFGRQSEIKFLFTIDGLKSMKYRAIALGPDDLRLPGIELATPMSPTGDDPSMFVSANVTFFDPKMTSPYLVLEEGGKRIGITAVLGQRNQLMVNSEDVTMRSAEEGLQAVWPELQKKQCDLYVLIAHATIDESRALAQKFRQFQLVVTTGGAGEPTLEPERIEGTSSAMIQVGTKGMYASVVGLFEDKNVIRYQRVPLDARFPDAPEMIQLLGAYQDQLKLTGFAGLGIRPQPHPTKNKFVGSEVCAECHKNAWKVWKEGIDGNDPKHSHAYATLQAPPKRANVPRNFDPECLSCHVVGWNPQKYYPYDSGYMSLDATPKLINVGCENCHGPGAEHTDAENGVDEDMKEEEIERLRKQQILTLKDAEQKCLECHDLDNSPGFQEEGAFDRYWAKIKHSKADKNGNGGGKVKASVN